MGRESLHHHAVDAGLEQHRNPGLHAAAVVVTRNLVAARLEVVARVQPEPGVVHRTLAGREGVRHGLGHREPVVVLARLDADGVNGVGGVAGEAAAAAEVARRRGVAAADVQRVRPFSGTVALDEHGVRAGLERYRKLGLLAATTAGIIV